MAKLLPLFKYIRRARNESKRARLIRQRQEGKFETSLERKVRYTLHMLIVNFEQEKYFRGVGMVDFYLPDYLYVLEADGVAYHSSRRAKQHDAERDRRLRVTYGLKVLRLPEEIIRKSSFAELGRYIEYFIKGESDGDYSGHRAE